MSILGPSLDAVWKTSARSRGCPRSAARMSRCRSDESTLRSSGGRRSPDDDVDPDDQVHSIGPYNDSSALASGFAVLRRCNIMIVYSCVPWLVRDCILAPDSRPPEGTSGNICISDLADLLQPSRPSTSDRSRVWTTQQLGSGIAASASRCCSPASLIMLPILTAYVKIKRIFVRAIRTSVVKIVRTLAS
jgi:hypothetical protein